MARLTRRPQKKSRPWWLYITIVLCVALVIVAFQLIRAKQVVIQKFTLQGPPVQPLLNPHEVLQRLVKTHPSPKISSELDSLITNQIIWISYQENLAVGETMASFVIIPDSTGKQHPVLNVHSSLLSDPLIPDQSKQLVLLHEFHHYEQWRDGTYLNYLFELQPRSKELSEEEMRVYYLSELEAYCVECDFALEYGWADFIDFCQVYRDGGRPKLAREFAIKLASTPEYAKYHQFLLKLAAAETQKS